jgi:vancomycin resistance protein VanJ
MVLGIVRLGDELWSPGPDGITPPPDPLVVLDWNLELDSKTAPDVVAGIAEIGADVVALQELTPDDAAAIEADEELTERYPYRILQPREGAFGLGLLARGPLLVREADDGGHVLHAGLLLEDGRVVEVLVVHPRRPRYGTTLSIPRSLDTADRDADLASIRARIDGLDDLDAVLVVGDLNATPSEPARAAFGAGLTDAHLAAGGGPGFTWRPEPLEALDVALLRIDAVLTGAWLEPVRSDVDCTLAGDHCRLIVTLRVVEPATDGEG